MSTFNVTTNCAIFISCNAPSHVEHLLQVTAWAVLQNHVHVVGRLVHLIQPHQVPAKNSGIPNVGHHKRDVKRGLAKSELNFAVTPIKASKRSFH